MPSYLRQLLFPVLAMGAVVVTSNIAVQVPINDWLTWGAFTYPLAFLVTDLSNRAFGPARARQVVLVGFVLGVVLSVPAGARIAAASGTAFLLAQLLDILIFNRLRRQTWWRAPLISSFTASALDTVIFFSLAFAGTGLPWVTWALGDYGVKIAMAAILIGPYGLLLRRLPRYRSPESASGV